MTEFIGIRLLLALSILTLQAVSKINDLMKKSIILLFASILITSCHSNKKMSEARYTSSDSCTVENEITARKLQSLTRNESVSSDLSIDKIIFERDQGEIRISTDGQILMTGVGTLATVRKNMTKKASEATVMTDSITENTTLASSGYASGSSGSESTPIAKSNHRILIFLLSIIAISGLVLALIRRYTR